MSDPTQAGGGPDSYTLQDWTNILHNAAGVPASHGRYQEARQVVQEAVARIGALNEAHNKMDRAAIAPSALGSAAVGFGHGASLGLAGDPEYMKLAHEFQPAASYGGDVVGMGALQALASPLVEGVGSAKGLWGLISAGMRGGMLQGALGAGRGAVEGGLPGALVGGALGAAAGAPLGIAGNVAGSIAKNVGTKVLPKIASALGGKIADEELLGNMSAGAIRRQLASQGFSADNIERAVMQLKAQVGGKLGPEGTALASRAATEAPARPPAAGTMAPIAGTGGRGFEVMGERATPPAPKELTIAEIQDRLAGNRARFAQDRPVGNLETTAPVGAPKPQVAGTMGPLAPKGEAASADATRFSPQLEQQRDVLLRLAEKLKRSLTAQETEAVLAQQQGRARVLRQQGFPASDAAEMAEQGTAVPTQALEKVTGTRQPTTKKWS